MFSTIIQIVLATTAILASIYAIKAYVNNAKSKRAYIAPASDPGKCIITHEGLVCKNNVNIKLENYGINPASDIIANFFFINSADVDGRNRECKPVITDKSLITNPVPQFSDINIRYSVNSDHQMEVLLINYIIFRISYFDKILNKSFGDVFYWYIDPTDKRLLEVPHDKIDRVKQIDRRIQPS
ncbi:MAG: hypothetical protein P9L97_03610 [Candidatus Tenebribacter davisii]|nr:hypothetical protein [Candidatus Tenebribacter davisii]